MLGELGYLDGEQVTAEGTSLSRIYSELDLLAAECLRRGAWRGLAAPALAAVLSALVFESRKPDDLQPPRVPGGAVRSTLEAMAHLWAELSAIESAHGLSFLREPDVGFAWAAYRQAAAPSSTTCSPTSSWAPATSSAGSSRSSILPTRWRWRPVTRR